MTSYKETTPANLGNLSGPNHYAKEVMHNGCKEGCEEGCKEAGRQEVSEEEVTTSSIVS
jgi:hypothetical protein